MKQFQITKLNKEILDRCSFKSDDPIFQDFLSVDAVLDQDEDQWYNLFVMISDEHPKDIIGYYSLTSTELKRAPDGLSIRSPKKWPIPSSLLGMLDVHLDHRKQGNMKLLVIDAVNRVSLQDSSARLLLVDAKREELVDTYKKLGFKVLEGPRKPGGTTRMYFDISLYKKALHLI
jgi:GNAT superfamily N-acetyltransferase